MAIFNIPATTIAPNAERRGAAVDPPARVTSVLIQLTDPNGVWNSTSGTITRWGVQASRVDGTFANNGTDFQNLGSVFQDEVIPFGTRGKDGGLPAIRMGSTDNNGNPLPIAPNGIRLRLAIQTTGSSIVLGAVVKTNEDAG